MTVGESFRRDGYCLLPQLLSSAEVDALRDTVPRLRLDRPVGTCKRPHNTLVPLRWDDAPVMTVLRDTTGCGVWRRRPAPRTCAGRSGI